MAQEPSGAARAELRQHTDTEWNFASKPPPKRRRLRPTRREKEAATDSVVVDIVDWLSGNPDTTEQIKTVAGKISTEVVDGLDQSFEPTQREQRRRELATSHFWCDLLATFARALDSVEQEVDKIPDIVAAELAKALGAERSQMGTSLVRLTVGAAWKLIKEIPFARQHVLRLIQMLAVMICPAPESHPDVVKYCVTPLTGGCVRT